tara:strand:- start:91 stop:363 length:273 start_codon:yes stop_codon:yes gene_type:complete
MPKYNFKCKECNNYFIIEKSVKEYISTKASIRCKECSSEKIHSVINFFTSSISKTRNEIESSARDDARKISEKIKNGDLNAIREIYGEES